MLQRTEIFYKSHSSVRNSFEKCANCQLQRCRIIAQPLGRKKENFQNETIQNIYRNPPSGDTFSHKTLLFLRKKKFQMAGKIQVAKLVKSRCLMVSTDQADPSCFYFRISWILIDRTTSILFLSSPTFSAGPQK